jgi:hypothetical protein
VGQLGACAADVLAVIKNQKEMPGLKVGGEGFQEWLIWCLSQTQSGRHCLGQKGWVVNTSQLNNPGAVLVVRSQIVGHLEAKARLSDTARPH